MAHSAAAQRAWQHLWPRFTDSLSAALDAVATGVQAARGHIEEHTHAHERTRRELSDAQASMDEADRARRAALSDAAGAKVRVPTDAVLSVTSRFGLRLSCDFTLLCCCNAWVRPGGGAAQVHKRIAGLSARMHCTITDTERTRR